MKLSLNELVPEWRKRAAQFDADPGDYPTCADELEAALAQQAPCNCPSKIMPTLPHAADCAALAQQAQPRCYCGIQPDGSVKHKPSCNAQQAQPNLVPWSVLDEVLNADSVANDYRMKPRVLAELRARGYSQ